MKKGSIQLDDEYDVKDFLKSVQDDDRDYGINFINLGNKSKNTIEFRLANGTIDANVWIDNINLFGGIIRAARNIAIIQQKDLRTENEEKTLELFEKLKDEGIEEKEKLKILLKLVILEKDRAIYTERYEVNSKLFEKNEELTQYMKKRTATGIFFDEER